jgi:N-acetylglucosamine-6-sulfatase
VRRAGRIGCVLAVVAGVLVACTGHTAPPRPTHTAAVDHRPNIVFVLTDDLSDNLVQYLPHVLEMEKSGTSFSRYYVVDSLCCPSRSAIFTGEYPHDDGVYTNVGADGGYEAFINHSDENKSFATTLQDSGYRTAMMGKYLNGYKAGLKPNPGWDEWDVIGPPFSFNYMLNEDGKRQHYGTAPSDYLTDVLSGKAVSFIDSSAAEHKPFMLEVATYAPHKPSTPAPRYAHSDLNATIPRTPAFDAVPKNPPDWLRGFQALPAGILRSSEHQYVLRVQSILAVDDLIARLEQELQAKGLAGNTYFVFSSDNGYHIGEYRLHAGKQTAFETDINVPLVITGPGVPAGRVDRSMTSSIDLAPTFESIAGVAAPSTVDGVSMLDLWHGTDPAQWQRAILIEHHHTVNPKADPDAQSPLSGDPPNYEAVRTENALLVRYSTGELEYYNTARDPYELDNAPSAAPRALISQLGALETCHGAAACQHAAQIG